MCWVLAGIAAHPDIGPSWVFKGGTCLKKCYFETYRFSEDLDFTLTDASHLNERWRPPSMAYAWHTQVPLEIVRFAGANRLCVNLNYQGSQRLVEPYALRRTRAGNLLLYAVKHQTGETRAYHVDRIQNIEATKISFVPRYAIELTPVAFPNPQPDTLNNDKIND